MAAIDQNAKLTNDLCRTWIHDAVFHFRPQDYCERYPKWPGMVGLEIEMAVFDRASLAQPIPKMIPLSGPNSSSQVLTGLAKTRGWQTEFLNDDPNFLFRVALDDSDQITFEPGGQVEISTKPYPCLAEAYARLESVQQMVDQAYAQAGMQIIQLGYQPWHSPEQIGLQMSKPRYRAMDQYFRTIGPYGPQMMRQTCTIQVNLDFGDHETTLAKRYLAANLLAPVTTAIFAYSGIKDGKLNDNYRSYRGRIWQGIDPSRTGFPQIAALKRIGKDLNKQACVDAYLESVLNAHVVFIEALNYQVPEKPLTMREWIAQPYKGASPTLADLKTHLSLHFPEVRARGFLELRSVDCQSRVWQRVPGVFYTSLLYDHILLDRVLEKLLPYTEQLPELWQRCAYGLQDPVLAQMAKEVMTLVMDGSEKLPACFRGDACVKQVQVFFEQFTSRNRCPADDILDAVKGQSTLHPSAMLQVQDRWQSLMG